MPNVQVLKRDCTLVDFDKEKIVNAIMKAMKNGSGIVKPKIADAIANEIEDETKDKDEISVSDIEGMVFDKLITKKQRLTARAYENYRSVREFQRENENTIDEDICELLDDKNEYWKAENANKNPILNTTKRDYMAGIVSTDATRRYLLPPDIVEAHDEGIIHFHDADYFAQHMHNCLSRTTAFYTTHGVKTFGDFDDGQEVEVYDKDGNVRTATVHYYGEQSMNMVVFVSKARVMIVTCTNNHRWLLKDGTVTTNLKVDDELLKLPYINDSIPEGEEWKVKEINPYMDGKEIAAWCIEEPITHSFVLEGGMITGNCDLVNLDDMLQNGTMISDVLIEKPHSFSTACTVTTQIIAQVASSQYGGQTITLTHLAPFVDVSRKKIREEVRREFSDILLEDPDEHGDEIELIVHDRLQEEITKGIQSVQYQLTTIMTTNGQAPFITVFMYLNEAKDQKTKDDLAWIIEETIKQRMEGVKNEEGVFVAPAFPKLIYVLEEDNIVEGSKYWYLTELAAECSSKRLVPDYISEKIMFELKGDLYPSMGCAIGEETVSYSIGNDYYTESFEKMWERLSDDFVCKPQSNPVNKYMDVEGVKIFDHKNGYVNVKRVIRNFSEDWRKITFENGLSLTCTNDHPFDTEDLGIVKAEDICCRNIVSTVLGNSYVKTVEYPEKQAYSYDVTTDSEHFTVSGIWSHNCRSFLTPDRFTDAGIGNIAKAKNYVEGEHKYYGRLTWGVLKRRERMTKRCA